MHNLRLEQIKCERTGNPDKVKNQVLIVSKDNVLLDGSNYYAFLSRQYNGTTEVPVIVFDDPDIIAYRKQAIEERKRLTPLEIVLMARKIRPLIREQAKANQQAQTKLDKVPIHTDDVVANFVDLSYKTLQHIEAAYDAAHKPAITAMDKKYAPEYKALWQDLTRTANRSQRTNKAKRYKNQLDRLNMRRQAEEEAPTIIATTPGIDTIVHGDAFALLPTIPDETFHACISSFPWGCGMKYDGFDEEKMSAEQYWHKYKPIYKHLLRVTKPGGFIGLFWPSRWINNLQDWLGNYKTYYYCKEAVMFAKASNLNEGVETISCQWKPGTQLVPFCPARSLNFFVTPMGFKEKIRHNHPCTIHLSMATTLINTMVCNSGYVLDPFCGIGSICIAAKNTGRHFMGLEQSARYVQEANRRLASGEVWDEGQQVGDRARLSLDRLFEVSRHTEKELKIANEELKEAALFFDGKDKALLEEQIAKNDLLLQSKSKQIQSLPVTIPFTQEVKNGKGKENGQPKQVRAYQANN